MGTVGRNLWWTLRHLFSDRISVTLPERVADRMADVPELPEDFLVVPAFVVRARGVPRYMSGYFAVAQGQAVFLGTGWFNGWYRSVWRNGRPPSVAHDGAPRSPWYGSLTVLC